MKTATVETKEHTFCPEDIQRVNPAKIDELLSILDKDIEHIQANLSLLEQLRTFVVKHNEKDLNRLLEKIRTESKNYESNELKRHVLRKQLAADLGCSREQMTLSGLEMILSGKKKAKLSETKSKLRLLTNQLKREHLRTALLLSECSRFNRLLLKSVFNFVSPGDISYNSKGLARRQTDTAFVNMRF